MGAPPILILFFSFWLSGSRSLARSLDLPPSLSLSLSLYLSLSLSLSLSHTHTHTHTHTLALAPSLSHTRPLTMPSRRCASHARRSTHWSPACDRKINSPNLPREGSRFINSQTQPLHPSEGDETRRQGSNSPKERARRVSRRDPYRNTARARGTTPPIGALPATGRSTAPSCQRARI